MSLTKEQKRIAELEKDLNRADRETERLVKQLEDLQGEIGNLKAIDRMFTTRYAIVEYGLNWVGNPPKKDTKIFKSYQEATFYKDYMRAVKKRKVGIDQVKRRTLVFV